MSEQDDDDEAWNEVIGSVNVNPIKKKNPMPVEDKCGNRVKMVWKENLPQAFSGMGNAAAGKSGNGGKGKGGGDSMVPGKKKASPPDVIDMYEEGPWPGIDAATAEKMKRGDVDIETRADLHFLDGKQARARIEECMKQAYRSGMRYALVITGRKKVDGRNTGVLAVIAKQKLKKMGREVAAICPATGRHGGQGAVLVKIRRKR